MSARSVSTDHYHSPAQIYFSRARAWSTSALGDLVYCGAIFLWSIVSFTLLVTGVSVTASLIALVIGFFVWIGFAYLARLTTRVDRSLAGWQRGQRIDAVYRRPAARGFLPLLKTVSSDPQTWKDLGWLVLTSVVGFTLGLAAISAAAIVVAYLSLPIWYSAMSDPDGQYGLTNLDLFTVDTLGEAFALMGIGLALAPLALLLARGCATAHAALAARALGPARGPRSAETSTTKDESDTAVREEVRTMSAHSVTTPPPDVAPPRAAEPVHAEADRYQGIQQYSLKKIIAVWAAAALPMGVLAWVVAPLTKDWFSGPEPLVQSVLVWLTAGLAWQFVLVLILLRQEIGSFEWPRVRDALWLRPPRDPKTGRIGGNIWWRVVPFVVGFAAWGAVSVSLELPIPDNMDLNGFLGSDTGQDFFSGAWGWFAVVAALAVFNTVLGEELLFRGVLLPRMRGVFGKRDWVANGAIFALYHLHTPWAILPTFVDGIFLDAYPSRRFQSAWMGIIVHSAQSVLLVGLFLALVLS